MGKEAHADPSRRYTASVAAGLLYIALGLAGGTIVSLMAAFPQALVMAVAGLALLGTMASGLAVAVKDEQHREAALLTFLVTVSGVTLAGVGSLLAEARGVLRAYIVEMCRAEWAAGLDIGQPEVLNAVAAEVWLEVEEFAAFCEDPANHRRLADHWVEAQDKGVIGVPSVVIDDQVFWGNDRIDFVLEHLNELRLARK
jgi:hypothetical protein